MMLKIKKEEDGFVASPLATIELEDVETEAIEINTTE